MVEEDGGTGSSGVTLELATGFPSGACWAPENMFEVSLISLLTPLMMDIVLFFRVPKGVPVGDG